MRIAVFASGSGSNFEALVKASREQGWPGEIVLLVCDRPGAKALERAERLDVPARSFVPKSYPDKAAYEADVLQLLREYQVDWIVLAGYMRLIGPTLLTAYYGRIVNIHPSLLPEFPGKHAVRQALEKGVKWTGVTVHLVDEGMDTGPILAQEPVPVEDGDDETTLTSKIQTVEHRLYPEVVLRLIRGEIDTVTLMKQREEQTTCPSDVR
ncbi:phosphoribosylglycinamide formyltransferase [Polycladomyces sp. WAk]|uniref:Phosphoribosylglycinamide formyltransferase n=1 Tax=Polycladomyces zharkentensis TaxID=2807616 RepID=A0ABS2WFH5_9BACL|nr:phosphoribosylglycinamide formyltransferase [Polycladomyces sp. WAk]MBN2908239.1 phosphoribosylglycinamide formyltransferase [Polycladomyces sp. WAk]